MCVSARKPGGEFRKTIDLGPKAPEEFAFIRKAATDMRTVAIVGIRLTGVFEQPPQPSSRLLPCRRDFADVLHPRHLSPETKGG